MTASGPLYFEDLTPGTRFRSREISLSAEDIKQFAAQYDPQPFHMDEEAAKDSVFEGLAASGWHTAATTMRLMVESMPVAGGLIGAGMEELRWHRPVRPGDSLRLEAEVLSSRSSVSKPNRGVVRIKHVTYNQNSEPVQTFTSTIIAPKR